MKLEILPKSKLLDAKLCRVVKQNQCHNVECECLKDSINMIEEGNDDKLDNFHNCTEALNKTNTLATKVLELNLS